MLLAIDMKETNLNEREGKGAPPLLTGSLLLPGAVQGVQQLARLGELRYYSIRARTGCSQHEHERQQAMQRWLRQQGFPHPERLEVCRNAVLHLLRLYAHILSTGEAVLLLTDTPQMQQEGIKVLEQEQLPAFSHVESQQIAAGLRNHLTLLTIGEVASAACSGQLRMRAIPTWEHLPAQIITLLACMRPVQV